MFDETHTKENVTSESIKDRLINAYNALDDILISDERINICSSNLIDDQILRALAALCYKHKNQLTVLKILEDGLEIKDPYFQL